MKTGTICGLTFCSLLLFSLCLGGGVSILNQKYTKENKTIVPMFSIGDIVYIEEHVPNVVGRVIKYGIVQKVMINEPPEGWTPSHSRPFYELKLENFDDNYGRWKTHIAYENDLHEAKPELLDDFLEIKHEYRHTALFEQLQSQLREAQKDIEKLTTEHAVFKQELKQLQQDCQNKLMNR